MGRIVEFQLLASAAARCISFGKRWTGRIGTQNLDPTGCGIMSLVAIHGLREVACLHGFSSPLWDRWA